MRWLIILWIFVISAIAYLGRPEHVPADPAEPVYSHPY